MRKLGLMASLVLLMASLLSAGHLYAQTGGANSKDTTVSGVGVVELISRRQVVLNVGGEVNEVGVRVGDVVAAGELLVALDTESLEKAVKRVEMAVEKARLDFQELTKATEPADIASAEANLVVAKAALAKLEAGASADALKAAQSSLAAAWATYQELKDGPTEAQLTQAKAALRLAEIDLQEAQRAYDKVKWQPDAGASSEGAQLQRATINYEQAKAGFDQLSKPATEAQLQGALASAYSAQDNLNLLTPTAGDLAQAKANVQTGETGLKKLKQGLTDAAKRIAELSVEQALLDLDEAKSNLNKARINAPIAGTVLEVAAEVGQQVTPGTVVVVLADASKLQLVVNVEQNNLAQVSEGQAVAINVYALPAKTYKGVVKRIAPVSGNTQSLVSFPVTITFTDTDLGLLRSGMTASATFTQTASADAATGAAGAGNAKAEPTPTAKP